MASWLFPCPFHSPSRQLLRFMTCLPWRLFLKFCWNCPEASILKFFCEWGLEALEVNPSLYQCQRSQELKPHSLWFHAPNRTKLCKREDVITSGTSEEEERNNYWEASRKGVGRGLTGRSYPSVLLFVIFEVYACDWYTFQDDLL